MSEHIVPMVGLDQADAAELAEICEHIVLWLCQAPAAVGDSLDRFVGQPGWQFELREELRRWAQRLETLEPIR